MDVTLDSFFYQMVEGTIQIIKWTDAEKSQPIDTAIPLWDTLSSLAQPKGYLYFWNYGDPIIPNNKESFLFSEYILKV